MAKAAFFLVILLLVFVVPVVLYYLVRAEHDEWEAMDREESEQAARRDIPDRD